MNVLKGTVIFLSGVTVGLGVGWIYFRQKMAEKDAEMNDLRTYYYEKQNKVEKKEEESPKEEKTEIDRKIKEYSKIIEDREEVDEKVMAEAESPEEEESGTPYLITEEEFLNDKNEYEKLSLTYFTADDTLADDCDEIVDVENTISTDIFNQIAESEDGDYYVRNNTLQTDYEIMKVDQSYKERYGFDY